MSDISFEIGKENLDQMADTLGNCIASGKIMEEGASVGYMYREQPSYEEDSGWVFFAGDEDEEYSANSENFGLYNIIDVYKKDSSILSVLNAPPGSIYRRNDDGLLILQNKSGAAFKTAAGVKVPSVEGLFNSYELDEKDGIARFALNVSVDTLSALMDRFIAELEAPAFFVLELPAKNNEENELRNKADDPMHKNVYYLDNLSAEELAQLWEENRELLLNDGMVAFGFASHITGEEIYVGKYKVSYIFSRSQAKHEAILEEMGFEQVKTIDTVWKHFTQSTPGSTFLLTVDGKTIYDLLEELTERGMYKDSTEED